MVAALLCFMWAMLAALGLSNLRYSETGSSRNNIIVGLSLFFSLSIPAYFQQYGLVPNANSSVPSYFQPYIIASHGPFHTGFGGVCHQLSHKSHLSYIKFNLLLLILLIKEGNHIVSVFSDLESKRCLGPTIHYFVGIYLADFSYCSFSPQYIYIYIDTQTHRHTSSYAGNSDLTFTSFGIIGTL